MNLFYPSKIFITEESCADKHALRMLARMPNVPVEIIPDEKSVIRQTFGQEDAFTIGKRMVLLTRHRGKFFKPCPSVKEYVCCNYQIFHLAVGCNFDCTYCILQAYLNNPILTFYTNLDEALAELESILGSRPDQQFRIGTGELTDSLSTDHLTGFSEVLIPFFKRIQNATLEFKTKSNNISNLLTHDPAGKIIVGWSFNTEKVYREEEHKTASLTERLEAAKQVLAAGYKVSFHFDPIIHYEGWEQDYYAAIDRIFDTIPSEKITFISLGALRFMPKLKEVVKERFPKSKIVYGEFVRGLVEKFSVEHWSPAQIKLSVAV
ncbi:MAG: hypothetical protein HZC17_03220 [Candidatus Omnitrophica bacterium]|nr:hypothetical protein [Candidatus Omnitrophota bacterium]